jgi:putative methionine-R-sulfoxide reductase with GAF domain
MSPLQMFILFIANTLALAITLSVLILALWQNPGDAVGRAVSQFLAALAFYNFTVMLTMATLMLNPPTALSMIVTNLSIVGYGLCIITAFAMIITLAGMMKQAFQVIARAGVVILILIQWPLWNGQFFTNDAPYHMMASFAPAGLVAGGVVLVYIVGTFVAGIVYRRRIEPAILLGVGVLLLGQVLALIQPIFREIGFASLSSIAASTILGYKLARMQLFNPLIMRTAQLAALRDVSRTLIGSQDLHKVLQVIVEQARRILNTDIALILLRSEQTDQDKTLVIEAQAGGTMDLKGRHLSAGDGLSGRIFQMKLPLRLQNYHAWEGQSSNFADVRVFAALGVPLIYDDKVLGVLNVSELKPGRQFTERDQAMLEMLAPQAAVAIVNANLRERLDKVTSS